MERFRIIPLIAFILTFSIQTSEASHAPSKYLSLSGAATTREQTLGEFEGRWSFAPLIPLFIRVRIGMQVAPEARPRLSDRETFESGVAFSRMTLIGRSEVLTSSAPFFLGDPIVRYRATGAELRIHFFDRENLELPTPETKDMDLQIPTLAGRVEWTDISTAQSPYRGISDNTLRLTQFLLLRFGKGFLVIPRFDFNTSNYRTEISQLEVPPYSSLHLRLVRLGPEEQVSALTGLFSQSQQIYFKWRSQTDLAFFAALTKARLAAPEREAWSAWAGISIPDSNFTQMEWKPSIEFIHQSYRLNEPKAAQGQVSLQLSWNLSP